MERHLQIWTVYAPGTPNERSVRISEFVTTKDDLTAAIEASVDMTSYAVTYRANIELRDGDRLIAIVPAVAA